jgi:hypothetical protein
MSCEKLKQVLEAKTDNNCFAAATSAKEGGKKFSFLNRSNKNICRVHVDDCLITDKTIKKCDYFFAVNEDQSYYLVEFKGIAVDEAILQIISTYEIVNEKIKSDARNFKGVIVSSSVPSATEQRFRKLQERCFREKRLKIIKTHIQHTEKV